ncbi:MAG: DUF929 family protein [Acidimicrobiales bacterium]
MAGAENDLTAAASGAPPRPGRAASSPSALSTVVVPPRPSGQRPGGYRAGRPGPRASARQLAQRRQHRLHTALAGAGAVVVIVGALVAVSLSGGPPPAPGTFSVATALQRQVESLPVSELAAAAAACAGSSGCLGQAYNGASPPQALRGADSRLTLAGKPEILYIGAEWCPFCAAERWPLVMALSKFGRFGPLRGTKSSSTDSFPDTPTFSFDRAVYSSKYLAFVAVEQQTRTGGRLRRPTNEEKALFDKWDRPPYVAAGHAGAIPFVYLGGRYLQVGSQYVAEAISAMSFAKAVRYLTSAHNATSRNAQAAAGFFVGDLCVLTHNEPAAVCSRVPARLKGLTASHPGAGAATQSG